jgi:histidinol phosphatase-like enzyme (inositol monophosphatase family)
LADAAGAAIRPHFRQPIPIETKPDATPVTLADRGAEQAVRALLAREVPEHGVIGEEFGRDRADAAHVWVIDPIDGTKAFISGLPVFGTLIALLRDGVPILGVMDQPISGERWIGVAGQPTTFNGRPTRTRTCPSLAQATGFATSPLQFDPADAERFGRVRQGARLMRYGTDCYGCGMMVLGFADFWIEAPLKLYDFAALVPIVQGAGGLITDWRGNALGMASDGRVLASGDAVLHREVIGLLAA